MQSAHHRKPTECDPSILERWCRVYPTCYGSVALWGMAWMNHKEPPGAVVFAAIGVAVLEVLS